MTMIIAVLYLCGLFQNTFSPKGIIRGAGAPSSLIVDPLAPMALWRQSTAGLRLSSGPRVCFEARALPRTVSDVSKGPAQRSCLLQLCRMKAQTW